MGKRMMDDDAQLLRRYAREGAEEAFAELVRRHLGLVYGSALRRVNGNAALAEEVAQEVFASVAHEAAMLEKKVAEGVTLAGWIYVMTKHAAANVVRAEGRRVRREQEAFVMSELESGGADGMTGAGAGDAEVWGQVRPELEAVMDELGEKDREAVLLRFFEGRAFGEIGAALRVSEDAARVRVNRALEKLRALLAKRGVRSTAAALGGLLAGNAAVAAPVGMAASVTGAVLAGGVTVAAVSGGVGSVSAAGAAGILSFMTTTKLVTGVACVVAAVSVGTVVFTQTDLKRVRAESSGHAHDVESARHRADDLADRLVAAEKRALAAEQERESAQKALEDALEKSKVAGAKQVMSPARVGIEISNILHEDPGFQEASLKKFLTSVSFKYAPFYRKMGMSADQIERFEKALLTREQAQIDQNAAARSQKLSIADPSLGKVVNPGFEEAYGELRRVLGDDGLKRFTTYENAMGAQGESRSMLAASLYSEAPLTLDQTEMLAEIMVAHRHSEKIGSVMTFTGYKWDEIGAKVAEALPEAQARFVRQHAERAKAEQLWGDYWRAAQTGKPLSEVGGAKGK
jgi:RNA polymerase sigma factor (sigma-70 family)